MNKPRYLLDSSLLIALVFSHDSQHTQALSLHDKYHLDSSQKFITQSVLAEVLTVLTYRTKSLKLANMFYAELVESGTLHFSRPVEESDITHFFLHKNLSTSHKLSWVDCSLLVTVDHERYDGLITLDAGFKRYREDFKILGV